MSNGLNLEGQKLVERLMKQIEDLHKENDELVKENKSERKRDNNIKLGLKHEIEQLRKQNLKLIKENNKLHKRIDTMEENNRAYKSRFEDKDMEQLERDYQKSVNDDEEICEELVQVYKEFGY